MNKDEGPVLAGLCQNARREGIKVLLTGGARDELFSGYYVLYQYISSSKPIRRPNGRRVIDQSVIAQHVPDGGGKSSRD